MSKPTDGDANYRIFSESRRDIGGHQVFATSRDGRPSVIPLHELLEIDPGFQRVIDILVRGVARFYSPDGPGGSARRTETMEDNLQDEAVQVVPKARG